MKWYLLSKECSIFLVSSSVLLVSILPSYADSSKTSPMGELVGEIVAQAANPEGNFNQERFPQAAPIPQPLTPETQPPVQAPTSETQPEDANRSIEVKKIEVIGSTIFKPQQFSAITQKVEGRTVSLEELGQTTEAITKLYTDRGYITSKAIVINQTISQGVVQIQVFEGGVEAIEIEGTKRIHPNYVRSRVALGIGQPLSAINLENQLRLLRSDPLFSNIEASLRTGKQPGQSIVVVRVTEAKPWNMSFNIDNYSPPSVGSERFSVNSSYRNITGLGDELSASYYRTIAGGADISDFNYRVPLNAMNGTLQLRTSFSNNKVIQDPFKTFDIRGESELYEISYRQPLVRSPQTEFALLLGFTLQNGQTFTFARPTPFGFGPDSQGNSRTRVIKFGQDYSQRDTQGAWSLRSLFSFGIGAFDATTNASPVPDGKFFSWLGQIQRVQRLSNNNIFITQLETQLTPDGLLPSQQFVIGGGQSVRGYRQNARAD